MPHSDKAKILLLLPHQLVDAADEVAEILQISRLGFIRQSIAKNVTAFHRDDKHSFDLSAEAIWRRREQN